MGPLTRALRLTVVTALTGAALTAGPGVAAGQAACANADARAGEASAEQRALATVCLVNEQRRQRGLRILRLDPRLTTSAQRHAEDMHARNYFAHRSLDGLSPSDRARAAGYPMGAGENLVRGGQTPAHTVALWLNSPSHRDNLLLERYRGIGMGQTGDIWVHTFGYAEPPADGRSGVESSAPAARAAVRPPVAAPGARTARLQVHRARVRNGRLDLLAGVTSRADGQQVRVRFLANGRRSSSIQRVSEGKVRVRLALPREQRSASSGIVELHLEGSEQVRPATVRLRAARRSARLEHRWLSLRDGVLLARGTVTSLAEGAVRLSLSYARPDGSIGTWRGRARVDGDGGWRLEERLPADARGGGQLSIQFTGYLPERIGGEQIARELLSGQVFG